MDQCYRHGLIPAEIKSQADQAAAIKAIYAKHRSLTEREFAGSEMTQIFTGGIRFSSAGPWYWIDSGGLVGFSNTTGKPNWRDDLLTDEIEDEIAYLCINAASFQWEACDYDSENVAYMCEERDTVPLGTYRRIYESPEITSLNPQEGPPGTVLTITGKYLNKTIGDNTVTHKDVNVTLEDHTCPVTFVNDTCILCVLPVLDAGVFPIRVMTSLGSAGPANLPLFTIAHSVHNITPAVGSIAGGQVVTIAGKNFPTSRGALAVYLDLWTDGYDGFNITSPNSTAINASFITRVECELINVTTTAVTCTTGPVSAQKVVPYVCVALPC